MESLGKMRKNVNTVLNGKAKDRQAELLNYSGAPAAKRSPIPISEKKENPCMS